MQLIFSGLIVIFGLTSVRPANKFSETIGTYRQFLEQEVVREQQAFKTIKDHIRFARQGQAHKQSRIYKKNGDKRKRETNKDGVGSKEPLTAKQEELNVLEKMNGMLKTLPDDVRVMGPKGFCINHCLYESVTKEEEPTASTPKVPDHIPDDKKPLYGRMALSIIKCVKYCGSTDAYWNFLLNILTMILNPDMVPEISPNSTILQKNDTIAVRS